MNRLRVIPWVVLFACTLGCGLIGGDDPPPPPAAPQVQPAVPAPTPAAPAPAPAPVPAAPVPGSDKPTSPPPQVGGTGGFEAARVDMTMRGACTNTCQYARDNECDDGRPNAHTSLCGRGTDCADCGPVGRAFRRGGRCTNTCQHANDGECDDGRPNAHTSICDRGTDCNDCGPVGVAFMRGGMMTGAACTNTCRHARDGECDDGRPNAHTSICASGTDCADCGPVGRPFMRGGSMGGGMAGACTNTCQHANDGECDDGRPNAHTSICGRGTDCADCGPVGQPFMR